MSSKHLTETRRIFPWTPSPKWPRTPVDFCGWPNLVNFGSFRSILVNFGQLWSFLAPFFPPVDFLRSGRGGCTQPWTSAATVDYDPSPWTSPDQCLALFAPCFLLLLLQNPRWDLNPHLPLCQSDLVAQWTLRYYNVVCCVGIQPMPPASFPECLGWIILRARCSLL